MASDARKVVESVLGGNMTAQVWTSTYSPVFPFTPQGFSVGALLPMILYLFRWGHRRGRGKFASTFLSPSGAPTIRSIAARLAQETTLSGFEEETARSILGDMLLTSALENKRHKEGHDEQVQRCFPNHYFASWIDLPQTAAHLRGVPEMITALLNDQGEGDTIEPFRERGRHRVGSRVQDNDLLKAFARGVTTGGEHKSNTRSDRFDETVPLALDQLIMVRMAQLCGEAPPKAVGKGEPGPISNQRSIAVGVSERFREDLIVFFDCYGRDDVTPRASLLAMLESCFAIGLSTITLSTAAIMSRWGEDGEINDKAMFPVFCDCSNAADTGLRDLSEQSGNLVRQAFSRLPAILMHARLLDFWVRHKSDLKDDGLPFRTPEATSWLNLLGEFLNGRHEEAGDADKAFRSQISELREVCDAEPEVEELKDLLVPRVEKGQGGRFLAEVLSKVAQREVGGDKLYQALTSALMTDETNGLARRRRIVVSGKGASRQRRSVDALSFVLTNVSLEYLVHRHLRTNGKGRKPKPLSFPEFLDILRERYGFYVDRSPPNMAVPNDALARNRRMLERRLRDLGLLVGVNDAERMKKLKARYRSAFDYNEPGETT
ncbi:hypothetical protein AMC87_PC00022 (plasmid) [Rhizobium phaseoli]|uniref:hypothetical protein n=1 Tax=Rhizobium phaseoli TaxID=396 RepID=UPI0007EB04FB|nr:hypothetical protein [Rhizobium phaseoli]ANL49725.1 hypothetical protein AMC87_PC00022 [Rhizobium phaseoli]